MTMDLAERVQHGIRRLPEPLVLEVLDFIGYLEHRHGLTERDVPGDEHCAGISQAISSFRGSGKGGGTARLLVERRSDLGREA